MMLPHIGDLTGFWEVYFTRFSLFYPLFLVISCQKGAKTRLNPGRKILGEHKRGKKK